MNKIRKPPVPAGSSQKAGPFVLGALWLFLFLGAFIPGAPLIPQYTVYFLGAGLLMAIIPPQVRMPKIWSILAAVFLLIGLTQFLPATWFHYPDWRKHLEALGLKTGPLVAIQWHDAIEQYIALGLILITGLWMSGLRASSTQVRNIALVFVVGVAAYALLAELLKEFLAPGRSTGHFGFFPNRNQSGTYLAMGATCGFGLILHSVQHRHFSRAFIAGAATFICLWAIFSWSITRAGIVLPAIGFVVWFLLLGIRYWSANELKGIGLIALLLTGLYFVSESRVKDRLSATVEEVKNVGGDSENFSNANRLGDIDARIPIFVDTLEMIKSAPWSGVGAGQFRYVFPQFENRAAFNNDLECLHPESDWLWIAADLGLPAALILLALVASAFVLGLKNVRAGKDRALRMACLVAAALVPLHGNLDVPGHRPILAWTSVFLFMLSLNPPEFTNSQEKTTSIFRAFGVVFVLIGIFLLGSPLLRIEPPVSVRSERNIQMGARLYEQTLKLSSSGSEKTRNQILEIADKTLSFAPLEQRLHRLEGFALVPGTDTKELADRSFAIERALAPVRVKTPMIQAREWMSSDLDRTSVLWREGLARADWMDANHPGSSFSRVAISRMIMNQAGRRALAKAAAIRTISESKQAP